MHKRIEEKKKKQREQKLFFNLFSHTHSMSLGKFKKSIIFAVFQIFKTENSKTLQIHIYIRFYNSEIKLQKI